jgi:glycosyltransferase involved in cell wall biosynthesis
MGPVYERTALQLVPSQWEEPFARVILEAHASGIPAIASAVGGIPEAMHSGGVLLPPSAPPDEWADAIERVLSDKGLYSRLSQEATQNASRPEFDPNRIADGFLAIARTHLRRCRSVPLAPRTCSC